MNALAAAKKSAKANHCSCGVEYKSIGDILEMIEEAAERGEYSVKKVFLAQDVVNSLERLGYGCFRAINVVPYDVQWGYGQ